MTRFIVFVLLLLIGRHVLGVTENIVTFSSGLNKELKVEPIRNVVRCALETNQDKKFEYVPLRKYHEKSIREDISMIDNVCSIRISRLNESHAGIWKVIAYTKREEIKENVTLYDIIPEVFLFKLYIHEEKQVLPSQYVDMYNMYDRPYRTYERREMQYVNVYDGRYVYIKYNENYKNLKACNLTGPVINSTNLLTEKRDDFQLFGQCGVCMKVNDTFKGSWKLDAIINDYVSYYISFYVHVHQKKEKANLNNMLVIQWTRGSPGIIELPNRVSDQSKICQIVDPNGIIVKALFGKCYYRVEVATIAHKGIWLVRYNVYGMLEPIEEEFRIEVSPEPFIFNANVTHTKNDSATLVCRLEMKQYSDAQYSNRQKSCNFVRPDGMTFYLMPGIGTERYIAYINSTVEQPKYGRKLWNKTMECAITIRKLEDVDYGAWRCYLKTQFSDNLYGSMLYVDYPDSRGNIDSKNKTDIVHVKRDDPFTINCVANSVLKYCWLRSPDGTSYLVARNNEAVSSSVLHYQSNGFTYGECKAEISAAMDSDYGQWTCFMGVADGNEISMTVLVIVTETYLVAEQTEIAVSPRNDPVLSCHILPRTLDRTVHYCRWIRPDGYGIYNDISHRYTTNSSYSQCRLVILEYRPEEDNGNWTCVAGLMGKNDQVQEAWDHINVYEIASSLNTSEISSSLNTSELLASH